jgi:iron complex outermembrane receptor protein
VWKFVTDHALALNVTRTERHPQAAELYADGPHLASGRVEVGDDSLDIESALTFDLSLRRAGDGITWTVNAFYNDYDDYIFLNPTGVDAEIEPGEFLPVFQVLQQGAKLYGYEAEILVPLNLVSVADIELRFSSDYVRGKIEGGGNLPQMPGQRFGIGLHTELGDWHAGIEAFYNAKQDKVAEYELPTDSFTTVDVDASRRIEVGATELFVFLRGSNLTNEEARQATSPLKDVVPLPGRSLSAGVRVSF